MNAKAVVRKYIDESMDAAGFPLACDASFIDRGITDSVGLIELVAVVEDAFHIRVADAEIGPANFGSLDAIEAFVNRRLATA